MPARELDSFFKEFADLANYALNEKEYQYPFVALVVGAECSVAAFEFLKDGSPPNPLYEHRRQIRRSYLCPITFFFYCPGREPFSARINAPGEQAVCRV
jgi:hypothetical protein